jgi:hypothetical protein
MSEVTLRQKNPQEWLNEIADRVWNNGITRKFVLTSLFFGTTGVGLSLGASFLRRIPLMKTAQYAAAPFGIAAISAYALKQPGYSPAIDIADFITYKKGNISSQERQKIDYAQAKVTELELNADHMVYGVQIIEAFKFLNVLSIDCEKGCSNETLETIRQKIVARKKLAELHIANLTPMDKPLAPPRVFEDAALTVGTLVLKNCVLSESQQQNTQTPYVKSVAGDWIANLNCQELETDKLEDTSVPFFAKMTTIDVVCPSTGETPLPKNMSELQSVQSINFYDFPTIVPKDVDHLCACPSSLGTVTFSRLGLSSDPAEFKSYIDSFEKKKNELGFFKSFQRPKDDNEVHWDPQTKTYFVVYERIEKPN